MPLNPLNHHYAIENPASVYDEEALTALQLAGRTTAKVNETVEAFNKLEKETNEHLDSQDTTIRERIEAQDAAIIKMNDVTMPAKVSAEVKRKIDSGEFAAEIDRYAGNLEGRVDNLLSNVPAGGTTMDAEVIDIRTPLEGNTHASAGVAVRSVEEKVIDIRNRANGGFTCFHDNWDKLTDWQWNGNIPGCCTTADGVLKWYDTGSVSGDPGVSVPVVKMDGAKTIYIDFDFSKVAGQNTLSVWVSSKIGYESSKCARIANLEAPGHFNAEIKLADYPFDINYIWLIAHSDNETGFVNLWIKVENLIVRTNILKDAGFAGETVDAHLLELKKAADGTSVGTSMIADGNTIISNPWEASILSPAGSTQKDGVITWEGSGDVGFGIIYPKAVDAAKLLRIEFDLETEHTIFNIYSSQGADLYDGYYVLGEMQGAGHYLFTIDPAHDDVYRGGIPKSIHILSHGNNVTATVRNLRIYQNAVLDAGGVESLEENLITLYSKGAAPTTTTNTATITSPDGMRYLVQVDNYGVPVCVPVIPKKVLYIGNSLLSGFGHGMAASAPDKDYYYLVNTAIQDKRTGSTASKLSGSDWEGMTTIAEKNAWNANTLAPKLSADLDLVIVQLGDNVNTDAKKAVLLEGAKDLLRFIRNKCPKARVVWAGAWYGVDNLTDIATACDEVGCQFINFNDLHTTYNESAVGNTWTDASGNVNTITSSGVASHPGDSGMKAIANRLLFALGITENESYYI